jgi:6-phosphogluconolactonase
VEVHAVAPADVGGTAAALIADALHVAVATRGRATLALSGGTTPAAMLTELAARPLPWEHIHVFQVDERVTPEGSSERNLSVLRSSLLDGIPLPEANVHPMPVTDANLDAAADRYATVLRARAGDPPKLDVVHLGLGADGHTASLAPGEEALEVTDRDVVTTGFYRNHWRMTMTLPLLSRARWVLWLVTGGEKAGVVRQLVTGDEAIPAARVRAEQAALVADLDAAALVRPSAHR